MQSLPYKVGPSLKNETREINNSEKSRTATGHPPQNQYKETKQ